MNRKKINKILSCTISGIYMMNYTPVFAESKLPENTTDIVSTDNTHLNITNISDNFETKENTDEADDTITSNNDDKTEDIKENTGDATEEVTSNIDETVENTNENTTKVDENIESEDVQLDTDSEETVELPPPNNSSESLTDNLVLTDIAETKETAIETLADTDEVTFKDENLHKKINEALGRGSVTIAITVADMKTLDNLNLNSADIQDLSGIEYAENVTSISLSNNNITSLQPLTQLINLKSITIQNNTSPISASEINSLSSLKKLEKLIVKIDDSNGKIIMNGEDSFPALIELRLTESNIGDIEFANLKSIQYINLEDATTGNINIENINSLYQIDAFDVIAQDINLDNVSARYFGGTRGQYNDISITNCNNLQMIEFSNSTGDSFYCDNLQAIQRIDLSKTNIGTVTTTNLNLGASGSITLQNSNIGEITLSGILGKNSYFHLDNITSNKVSIYDNEVCGIFLYNNNIENISMNSMPNLQYIWADNSNTSVLDLSKIESLVGIYLDNSKVEELIIKDIPNFYRLYFNNSESKVLTLENLPSCAYVFAENLQGNPDVSVINCPKIEYFNIGGSMLNDIIFKDSFNNVNLQMRNVKANSLTNYGCSIFNVFMNNANIKNIDIEANGTITGTFSFKDGVCENLSAINTSTATIFLSGTSVKNLKLGGFDNTVDLNLSSAGLETLELDGFTILKNVDISNNKLNNIETLKNITSLETVIASNNQIKDIAPIASLTNVVDLDFSNNYISTIESLKSVTTLENVNFDNNMISDISALSSSPLLANDTVTVLNQNVELPVKYSKGKTISIKIPTITDIDNSNALVTGVSNGGVSDNNSISWNYDAEGLVTETISFESKNGNFSVNATQDIIVDYSEAELNLSLDKTEFTNSYVTITAVASDDISGVKGIYTPDNSFIASESVTFKAEDNGEYTFMAEDIAGNLTTKTITVSNIDKEKPILNIETLKDLSNNEKVIVEIKATDNLSGIKTITLPNGSTVSKDNIKYTFDKNGTYKILVEDNAGNISIETIKITDITADSKDNTENKIPNTGGYAGILSIASLLSILSGISLFKRRKEK